MVGGSPTEPVWLFYTPPKRNNCTEFQDCRREILSVPNLKWQAIVPEFGSAKPGGEYPKTLISWMKARASKWCQLNKSSCFGIDIQSSQKKGGPLRYVVFEVE